MNCTPLTTAQSALAAGLCPIRARADGSKAPLGQWKRWQSERPDAADLLAWFPDWPNLGLVTGAISDRLICLEFEGRFMARWHEVRAALEAGDLWGVFTSWADGYCEDTPSGGLHVLVHLGGDGVLEGNQRIAANAAGEPWIETRGEGGFVIIAPSNGSTHPSGGSWTRRRGDLTTIAWVTPSDWDDVITVLASFDELPPQPAREERPRHSATPGTGWLDEAARRAPMLDTVLIEHGWRYVYELGDRQMWRRPGKDRGVSASVRRSGDRAWLYNHSTNAAPVPHSPSLRGQTFDVVDIIGCYELGHLPSLAERTEILRRWAPARAESPGARRLAPAESTYLDDSFWSAQPWLARIHEVALQRLIAPEALLGAFLSAWSAMIPPGLVIPPIVVHQAPLNLYCTLVGPSGGGKTGANALAQELLGFNQGAHPEIRMGAGLRSGEGLVTLAVRPQPKRGAADCGLGLDGPSYRQAVQLVFDEGTGVSAQSERIGSTILPWLCTIWAGSPAMVGGSKASGDEGFPANQVRFSMLTSTQPGAASALFTGESQRIGFPQRLVYFATDNPVLSTLEITADLYPHIEPIGLPRYSPADFRPGQPIELGFPPEIWKEVRGWHQRRTMGQGDGEYDGHRMNLRLRLAGLMALARAETIVVTEQDWALATALEAHSRAIRGSLIASFGQIARDRAFSQGRLDHAREEGRAEAWVSGKAVRLARWVHDGEGRDSYSRKELKGRLDANERQRLSEILEYAEARGWLIHRDGLFFRGESKPS